MTKDMAQKSFREHDSLVRMLKQAENALANIEEGEDGGSHFEALEIENLLREAHLALEAKQDEIAEMQKIARIGSWVWEIQSNRFHWSGELNRVFGIDSSGTGASYERFLEMIHPKDRGIIIEKLDKAYEEKDIFEFTGRIVPPDGSVRTVLGRGRVFCDAQSEPERMVGTLQDITELAQAQESLRNMNTLLHAAVYGAPIILFMMDAEGVIQLSAGKSLAQLQGDESSIGRSIYEVYEGVPQIIHNFERALSGERFVDTVMVDEMAFEAHYRPNRNEDGEIKGVIGVALDVTERLRTEQILKENEEHLRLLLNSIKDYAIFTLDENGVITSWNSGARSIKGYTSDEVINEHFSIFYLEEDRKRGLPQEILDEARSQGHCEREGWRVRKDGTHFWANVLVAPLLDEDGELRGFSKIVRDITPRKNMEDALRESETRFRTIFEGAAIGIELIDMQGRLLAFNPAICKMLGYDRSELNREALLKNDHPANVLANLWQFSEMQAGSREFINVDKPYQHKDGHWVWGRLSAGLVRDTEGEPVYVVAMVEDIDDRHRMKVELVELQRRLMEGRESERLHLAQELHDGPVQELYGLTYTLNALGSVQPGEVDGQSLKEAQKTIQDVIHTLRTMSSELRPPTLAPFGLEKAISSHAQQFQEDHPELNIQLDLMPDRQSMPEQARLALFRIYQASLANALRHAEAEQVVVRFTLDSEEIVLEIEDDGKGFQVPVRWITLARQGHLGLVGAMERAESIGGKFEVRSEPGKGTCVRVAVPRAELEKLASDD